MLMLRQPPIFGDEWLKRARAARTGDCWISDVIKTFDTTGQIYLSTLRLWFTKFPLTPRQKQGLRSRLESFRNDEHLGGVNELAWWALMLRDGLICTPIPPAKSPRPDFELQQPAECFVEVSTLNVSLKDKRNFETEEDSGVLDHAETIRRVMGKLTAEKEQQMKYAADHQRPGVLVIFDYTTWSGFGTRFFRTLGEFLVGKQLGFKTFPPEVSAMIYLERKVLDGRIALNRHRSAIYYNPLALHSLAPGTFASLNQFWSQLVFTESKSPEHWLWL
jgi:hypothetical protein